MGPLEGIKVLEMGQLLAGPFCGQILADFGADLVKIEPPEKGDVMRQWGQEDTAGNPVWWSVIGRNKRSITIDLRTSDGQALAKRLAKEADILIENFRVGTLERWGLGWDKLSNLNPKLIMVRITGFGQTGPYSSRAGFASVCEAMGGLRYLSGYPDRAPVRVGISLGDSLAGMQGAMGALMALQYRHKTGLGQLVDSSIFESVLSMMECLIPEYQKAGHIRERSGSSLPGIAPSNAYPTRDGREIIIGANHDTVFKRLCKEMGAPELSESNEYDNHRARGRNQKRLDQIISEWTMQENAEDLVKRLSDCGVPAGLAYSAPDMLEDEHFKARQAIVAVEDHRLGNVFMQNVFPKLSVSPGRIKHSGPKLGEHTQQVIDEWLSKP